MTMHRIPVLVCAALTWGALEPLPATAQQPAPAALVAAARAVGREMAGIRELPWREPVAFRVSDRAAIQTFARAALDREMAPAEWAAQQALFAHAGLIGPGVDMRELAVQLYTEQVAGYYDPDLKTFYLADWLPQLIQRAVVAHEITHALQDQHFDLVPWLDEVPATEDGALARAAVIEGDAMTAMLAYLLVPAGASLDQLPDIARLLQQQSGALATSYPTFDKAPPALQRLLLFPYVEGSAFVLTALKSGGWAAVDALYRDPPRSTEQVLHPERYFGPRDAPRTVAPPALTGARLIEGSWGELGVSLILGAGLSPGAAAAAARGWDGDRYVLARRPGGGLALAWTLRFDTPAAAARFATAYAQSIVTRFPGPARVATGDRRFGFAGKRRTLALTWKGDRVEIRETAIFERS
ncbi:MAG: hypothetical protein ABR559_08110 [Gemmatimonadota bacterium]